MNPIKVHAMPCMGSRSIFLKLELNGYEFNIQLPSQPDPEKPCFHYSTEIPTLELFKFIRENMDLRTINQFKQLEEIKE